MSEKWTPEDKDIYLVSNFSDVRVKIDVKVDGSINYLNNTIDSDSSNWETGMNMIYNDTFNNTKTMYAEVVINAKNKSTYARRTIELVGHRCDGPCLEPLSEDDVVTDTTPRMWSFPTSWPSGIVPVSGDDVKILQGMNMILDIAETPIFGNVEVNGMLSFKNDTDIHLRVKHLFIRAGELHIGSKDYPFKNKAIITLHGAKDDRAMVYETNVEAGNKVIANVGKIVMVGTPRIKTLTRLVKPAQKGSSTIQVETGLDLVEGDKIALAATSFKHDAGEDADIVTYDDTTGEATLKDPLLFYHWGSSTSTSEKYGKDIRGEVILLTRNIKI
jgi:archaellum component FlaG (FlaF/FlaG flagellin family)